jgi:hypothetical protein
MSLVAPYFGQGYNVTTDNFFTSVNLAEMLLNKATSIVGTMRCNRKGIPPVTSLPLYDSTFFEKNSLHLTMYEAKKSKMVVILSTLHRGASRQSSTTKQKPDSVLYYNTNKCGVDLLDSMCRAMTTKAGCRRWPLAVFYNILDLAAVNAWIIYRKATGKQMSRREYLLALSQELTKINTPNQDENAPPDGDGSCKLPTRVTCQIKYGCNRNRTTTSCSKCKRPVCGQCLSNVCMQCV